MEIDSNPTENSFLQNDDNKYPGNVDTTELPWVEKYRPLLMKDVIGNEEVVSRLQIIAQKGNMPNMLLSGPPGIGKTTSILCLANELLGPQAKDAVLELNASDDRGIDVIRNTIKTFAQTKVTLPAGRHKIVILDEADSMTTGAQQALRRTMEIYSNTTRFALACNTSNKIIEPIQSRCTILKYSKLSDKAISKRLLEICELEGVKYSSEGIEAIIFTAEGDMRQAVNNLQSAFTGFSFVNAENVYKVCDQPHPGIVSKILDDCYHYRVNEALTGLTKLWEKGYSAMDIVTTMFRVVKFNNEWPEGPKLDFIKEIGFAHMKILEGVSTHLQLIGLVSRLCMLSEKNC